MAKNDSWDRYYEYANTVCGHYSMHPDQQKIVLKYASKIPEGGLALEVGIAHGKTAALLIQLSKEKGFTYVGIDNFSLDSNYSEVKKYLDGLSIPYELIHNDSRNVVWDRPLDLLIIDGGHAEPEVSSDTTKFIPHIKPGGYLFLHDYVPLEAYTPTHPHWSITYYGEMYTNGWKDLGFYGTQLKVKQRPKDLTELIIKAPDIPRP